MATPAKADYSADLIEHSLPIRLTQTPTRASGCLWTGRPSTPHLAGVCVNRIGKDDTLLPVELNKWGLKCSKHNFNSWPYLVGVWVSMAVAIFSLLSNYSVDTKTPAPTPIEIRLHEHDRFDSQLSTTLNDTLQQLSKTVDRLVPVVNLLVEQQAQPQPPPRRRRPRAHPERGGS